jgi:proteasome assembly chaperone (PAC2) family protein
MEGPGPEHFIFIPGVLLLGLVIGYVLGGKSAREVIEKRRKRARQ